MKSLRFLDRRAGYSLASLGLLLGMVVPAVFPAFASADTQITGRGIEMSTATPSATAIYELTYTSAATIDAGGLIEIDFCSDSPIIGISCNTTGVPNTSGVSLGTTKVVKYNGVDESAGASVAAANSNHSIAFTVGTTGYSSGQPIDIKFEGITNPSTTGTFYARVVTYTSANKSGYSSPSTLGTDSESGGVALSTTDSIGVTATVKESLTFCIAGGTNTTGDQTSGDLATYGPSGACGTKADLSGHTTGVGDPALTLGDGGSPSILETAQTDSGFDWAQISTNAASGVVVRVKDDNSCGGLKRTGATNCDIAPAGATAVDLTGLGKFGMRLDAASAPHVYDGTSTGVVNLAAPYDDATDFGFDNTSSGNTVSGTYGSQLFDTYDGTNLTGAVSNKNIKMTFGASASPLTPAGIYKANLSLIATGTY